MFGDAAFGGKSSSAPLSGMESSSSSASSSSSSSSSPEFNAGTEEDDSYSSSQQPSSSEDATSDVPEFDESTISEEDLFEDDGTTFSTYDDGDNAPEMPSTPPDGGGEGSSSILGQLWDLFRDFTDRD